MATGQSRLPRMGYRWTRMNVKNASGSLVSPVGTLQLSTRGYLIAARFTRLRLKAGELMVG